MKRLFLLLALLSIIIIPGCDTFRKLAGKPTSSAIKFYREEYEQQQEKILKAKKDSIAQLRLKLVADSLEVADSLFLAGNPYVSASSLKLDKSKSDLNSKFYIVIGSFRQQTNADALVSKLDQAGYKASMIIYSGGTVSVGLDCLNSYSVLRHTLEKVQTESFFSNDVWILVNN